MSSFVDDLRKAISAHDLDAVVSCFTEDYRCDFPLHRGRGFVGQDMMHEYWAWIFSQVPDIEARVARSVVDGDLIWSEWELSGTTTEGSPHLVRGVVITKVDGNRAEQADFYLEPVE